MKVLMINGSPNKTGCTFTALKEIEKELIKENIEHIEKVIEALNKEQEVSENISKLIDKFKY